MSESAGYIYGRSIRRQMHLDRVRAKTGEFYRRYLSQLQDMLSQGFDQYIPSEISRLESDLNRMKRLLDGDPEGAREISRTIGSYIRETWALGRAAERQFRNGYEVSVRRGDIKKPEERQNEKPAAINTLPRTTALEQAFYQITGEVSDRIIIDLAVPEFEALYSEIQGGDSKMTIEDLKKRAAGILAEADKKAKEWKQNTVASQRKAIREERIAEAKELLAAEDIKDREKAGELLDKLDSLRDLDENDENAEEALDKELSEIEDAVDDTLISEEIRRETVKAIYMQLQSQEFTVDPPQQLEDRENDYVLITARRPSGKRVTCRLDLHGELTYKFDNYEGQTCLKDVERFNVDLQRIYSIELSDKRVLWQNPDDEDNEARDMEDPDKIPDRGGTDNGF